MGPRAAAGGKGAHAGAGPEGSRPGALLTLPAPVCDVRYMCGVSAGYPFFVLELCMRHVPPSCYRGGPRRPTCFQLPPTLVPQASRESEALRDAYKERSARLAAKVREWEEERAAARRRLDQEAADLEERRRAVSLELHVSRGRAWDGGRLEAERNGTG